MTEATEPTGLPEPEPKMPSEVIQIGDKHNLNGLGGHFRFWFRIVNFLNNLKK